MLTRLLVLIISIFGIAACGTQNSVSETPPTPISNERAFAEVIEENTSIVDGYAYIDFGHEVCDALDSGEVTATDIALYGSSEVDDPYEFGFVVGASIGAFCPEYSDQIPN